MKKGICAVFITVILITSLFAFSSKSVGLTNSDITAFINNYSKMESLISEKLVFEPDVDTESLTLPEILALIPSNQKSSLSKELNNLGLSGSNAVEKFYTISYGVAYSYMKSFYELMKLFVDEDDDSMAEMDVAMAIYENSISEADFKLIENNSDALFDALGFNSDGGYSDEDYDNYDWSDYDWDDDDYDYDWGDYDWSDYDWGDYGWDDAEYGYEWGDDDYEYDWDDYDWSDYDWDDYFTEEEELESETGVAFLKALIPSLSPKSGTSDFLYKTIKPGTYTKIKETDQNAFMFQKDWAGSKYPSLTISDFCISMSYEDPNDPDANWDDEVYKYFPIDATTELYKATIRGSVYYERVIKTKQYGTIRIWVDATNLGEGEDVYYSSDVYAVLSIGDFIIEGTAIVAAG